MGSNCLVEKFLRRAKIQRLCNLHEKGGTQLPAVTEERMEEVCPASAKHDLKNTYNVDQSGLFYRRRPN